MKTKLAMVTLLLATAVTATSCNSNNFEPMKDADGKSVIFSLKSDGTTKDFFYTADELLSDLGDSQTATSKLYSEVSRQVFTQYALNTLDQKKIESLQTKAADEVTDFKEDCETKAKEEGTDYDTYLETALEQQGVETTEELEVLFFNNLLKEEVLEDYLEEEGHYNYFLEKYLNTYTPFQVKHILVAANTADANFRDGTMTADNARKLLKILNGFINGESFDTLATETDDTGSANNGGVMPFNEAQNYVSEFRFATYVQEIFQNIPATAENAEDLRFAKAVELHVVDLADDATAEEKAKAKEEFLGSNLYAVYKDGISTVSLEKIMELEGDVTSKMAGAYNYYNGDVRKDNDLPTIAEQPYEMNVEKFNDEGELNKKYYEEYKLQRNQIFNDTLNTHQVKYIELGKYADQMSVNKALVNGKYVLADEYGNPIFVALASTGIHFMSMVWNANNPIDKDSYTSPKLTDEAVSSLNKLIGFENTPTADLYNQAYFTLYDDDKTTLLSDYQYTYIGRNGAYKSKTSLKANSDALLSAISSYVTSLEYYVFDAIVYSDNASLVDNSKVTNFFDLTFFDYNTTDFASYEEYVEKSEVYNAVKDYVQDSLKSTDESFATSVASAVETYANKLAREAEVKASADNWKYNAE